MLKIYKEIKRWIAERLFETELDEDYRLGIGEGQRSHRATLIIQLTIMHDTSIKKDQPGIQKVINYLKENL